MDKLSSGTIIVKGLSGCGKSSLIKSQNFEADGWVFATGKYEWRRRREPYSALIHALNSLVDKWITNNENSNICRMINLSNLLDEDLSFLENILPKLFQTIKNCKSKNEKRPQATSPEKSEEKSSSRLNKKCDARCESNSINAAFWRILSFFCDTKPVVLFLDDIQWADQASLDAIQVLSSAGKAKGFLLIVSFREEEIAEGDSVSKCLDFMEEEGQRVKSIHVTDLDVGKTNTMVASILQHESEGTLEFSKIIHNKTAGNPFFVVQFLQMLRNEYFLTYNFLTLKWEWGNTDEIDHCAHVSDNVADVIASSMSKVSSTCLLALKLASCLGNVIPMEVIIKYLEELSAKGDCTCDSLQGIRLDALSRLFDDAVKLGILIRLDGETFMWAHDKLQNVAYSMIGDVYIQKFHKSLGMILWEMHKSNPEDEYMLYMAADQLNHVTDVTDDGVSHDIARLSFQAAQLSMSKAALFPALEMARFAAKHLGDMKNSWLTAYELSLDVYSTLAQISIRFVACYEEAMYAAIRVDRHAKTLEDKARAQFVMIWHELQGGSRDYKGAIDMVKKILLDYGVKFPAIIIPGQQYLENRKLKARLGGTVNTFLTIPKLDEDKIENKRKIIILTLLAHFIEYSFYAPKLKDLNYYATTRILNMSIKEGTSSATALAIAHFGGLLGRLGQYKDAKEWGEVAKKLVDTFPRTLQSRHSVVKTWATFSMSTASVPFHKMLEPILELNRSCLKAGDVQAGFMAWIGYSYAYISVGLPLDPLNTDIMSFSNEAQQFGLPLTIRVLFPIIRQTIQNLKGLNSNPTLLKGDVFDQEKELKKFKDIGLKMTLRDINSFRLMLACIYQEWDTAKELINALEPFLNKDPWYIRHHLYLVYMGYASIALGRKVDGKKGQHFRQLGNKIIRKFKELLKRGSADALPIIQMLQAIKSPSKERFDEVRRTTARQGLIHYEAFVYENAGLFFMQNGNNSWGEYYLSEATKLYAEWGANGKTAQMLRKYDFLRSSAFQNIGGGNIKGRSRFSTTPLSQMRMPITSSINVKMDEKESYV